MHTAELARGARVVVEQCLALKPGEQMLVVTDTMSDARVTEALLAAAIAAGAEGMALTFRARRPGEGEPPPAVAQAMQRADAVLLHTARSLTHAQARVAAQQAGVRVISMPGVSAECFRRVLGPDVRAVAEQTQRLAERVATARTARITSPLGTDVRLTLGNPVLVADGLCQQRGELDFLPNGLFLSVPTAVEGVAVVDGSITLLGRLAQPVAIRFAGNRAVAIEGGPAAQRLQGILEAFDDPGVFAFAAWGIGTNPGAQLIGEDPSFEGERIYGWAHVSLGANATLPGGSVRAPLHLDAILCAPTVSLDDEVVATGGKVLV